MPSLVPEKKWTILRVVSIRVPSFARLSTSMRDPSFCKGLRKGMASMYPVVGKASSNIIMRRISSVRTSLRRMVSADVENSSSITLPLA